MNKTVLAIIIVIIVLVGGAFAYKTYKQNQMQNNQPTTQSQTIQLSNTSSGANTSGNTVDQTSSPQEQQAQQNLNSLDGGDHN